MSKITPSFYETIECVKLLKKKIKNDPYIGTVFENARFLTSRAKGAFFEKLTKEYYQKSIDRYKELVPERLPYV